MPTPETVAELTRRGFQGPSVELTGVPVRAQFSSAPAASDARVALGLDPDARVALLVAGASDAGPYERLAKRVPAVVSAMLEGGLFPVVLVGRNEALGARVGAEFGERVRVVPYTDEMAMLVSAADVVVAKPGGSILAEVIACGRPLVLLSRGNGQERANSHYLEHAGAALIAETDESLRGALAVVARGETSLHIPAGLARPDAARRVAEVALEPFL